MSEESKDKNLWVNLEKKTGGGNLDSYAKLITQIFNENLSGEYRDEIGAKLKDYLKQRNQEEQFSKIVLRALVIKAGQDEKYMKPLMSGSLKDLATIMPASLQNEDFLEEVRSGYLNYQPLLDEINKFDTILSSTEGGQPNDKDIEEYKERLSALLNKPNVTSEQKDQINWVLSNPQLTPAKAAEKGDQEPTPKPLSEEVNNLLVDYNKTIKALESYPYLAAIELNRFERSLFNLLKDYPSDSDEAKQIKETLFDIHNRLEGMSGERSYEITDELLADRTALFEVTEELLDKLEKTGKSPDAITSEVPRYSGPLNEIFCKASEENNDIRGMIQVRLALIECRKMQEEVKGNLEELGRRCNDLRRDGLVRVYTNDILMGVDGTRQMNGRRVEFLLKTMTNQTLAKLHNGDKEAQKGYLVGIGYDWMQDCILNYFERKGGVEIGKYKEGAVSKEQSSMGVVEEAFRYKHRGKANLEQLVAEQKKEGGILHKGKPVIGEHGEQPARYMNYFIDDNPERKALVLDFLINQMKEYGLDDQHAKKTMTLAEDVIWALGIRSKANWAFDGGDEYSEMIYFDDLIYDNSLKGKQVGSKVIRGLIKSIVPDFIQYSQKEFDPDTFISWQDIDYSKIRGKRDFDAYFGMVVPRKASVVRGLLLDPPTDEKKVLTPEFFNGINDAFLKCEPDNMNKDMRAIFVADLLERVLQYPDTTWTKKEINQLKTLVTKNTVAVDEDVQSENINPLRTHFITMEQWKWAYEVVGVGELLKKNRQWRNRLALAESLEKYFRH